jgi:hypothetical protein
MEDLLLNTINIEKSQKREKVPLFQSKYGNFISYFSYDAEDDNIKQTQLKEK